MNKMMAGATFAAALASLPALAGPTEITQCQTISAAGSYVLANNLELLLLPCLNITTSDVTIDLAGFQIIASRGPALTQGPVIAAQGNVAGIAVRNGSIFADRTIGVNLPDADGSIVEGLRISLSGPGATGIIASGVVRGNTITGGGLAARGTGIEATGTVTNNYVSGLFGDGISVGAGSTVIGNTSINNGGAGITASCPANLIDNTAVGNGTNLLLNGKGCLNKDNVAPPRGENVALQQ
jgi:hypothetical protein